MVGIKHVKRLLGFTILALILFARVITAQGSPNTVVIVNLQNRISEITVSELRKIYYGKKSFWPDGNKIEPVELKKDRKERQEFSQIVFQQEPGEVERVYLKMALSGQGHPPEVLSTPQEVVAFVSGNSGAIGYVDEVDLNNANRVKVILIRE